ncbi:hypothetical protein C1646_755872 [Rhizophagus diaphanus]|nr:hypothetical protein C1646_755872 [Rhizophagus diaphanus] [Rhizophagus sp. MUCL 43196]
MADYKDFKVPYEFEYIPRIFSIESWWKMIEQHDNWIREIALIINSITPHNKKLRSKKKNLINLTKKKILIKIIIIDKYFNINEELRRALRVEIKVVIEQPAVPAYDHGEKEFDIIKLLDSTLN